jgi:hypothetical protein
MKPESRNGQKNYENDRKIYGKFVSSWQDGTLLPDTDEVCAIINDCSLILCNKFKRRNDLDDIRQICSLLLSSGQYKALSSLRTYIWTIITREIIRLWKQDGKGMVGEFYTEWADPTADLVIEEVIQRLYSEKFMRELLLSRPELQQKIIKYIVQYDGQRRPSRSQVIRALQKENYTGYRIKAEYDKLEEFLCRFLQ